MKVSRSIEDITFDPNSYITIGTFDGVHLGHQKIIRHLVQTTVKGHGRSVLVTFYPHPMNVIKGKNDTIKLLTTLDEKIAILDHFKLDELLVIPFTRIFSAQNPEIFIKKILVNQIGIKKCVIGFNHAFGKDRKGNTVLIQKMAERLQFSVDVVQPVEMQGSIISSTRIRKLLLHGDILNVNKLLGRNFSVSGKVVKGKNLGRQIGFPTANLGEIGDKKCVPPDGVYAAYAHINGQRYEGTVNIGTCPTVRAGARDIEVHVHHFSQEIYNQPITLEMVERIRDESCFDSLEDLRMQIQKDKKLSTAILANH